jgi:hypothetical protein
MGQGVHTAERDCGGEGERVSNPQEPYGDQDYQSINRLRRFQERETLRDILGEALTREVCPWCGQLWECQPTCRSRIEDGAQE